MRVAEVIEGTGPVLMIADHAGTGVPDGVDLGVGEADMARHIASDLGTDALTRRLAAMLDARAVLARVSRLVVDLNRPRSDPAAVRVESDGVAVPGNRLDPAAREARLVHWHDGYHDEVTAVLAERRPRLIVSLHSFTPMLADGAVRPWDLGVLYNRDEATGRAMLAALGGGGWTVGDQEPYSGKLLNATLDRHTGTEGKGAGVSSVSLEVRQDHLADPAGVERVADTLAAAIKRVLGEVRG